MKKRLLLIVTVLAVGLVMLTADAEMAFADEAALVRVWAQGEGASKALRVDPLALTIEKNTIVVWMNGVAGKEIQIAFEEGKTCRDVTLNPNVKKPGFYMDSKGCYVTSYLPYATTSTLQFPEVGSFDYTVMSNDGTMSGKGKIIVKYKIKDQD